MTHSCCVAGSPRFRLLQEGHVVIQSAELQKSYMCEQSHVFPTRLTRSQRAGLLLYLCQVSGERMDLKCCGSRVNCDVCPSETSRIMQGQFTRESRWWLTMIGINPLVLHKTSRSREVGNIFGSKEPSNSPCHIVAAPLPQTCALEGAGPKNTSAVTSRI
jgi:hypothetical protein